MSGWSYYMTPGSVGDMFMYGNGPLADAATVPSILLPGMNLDPALGTADCSALTGADEVQCYAEKIVYQTESTMTNSNGEIEITIQTDDVKFG